MYEKIFILKKGVKIIILNKVCIKYEYNNNIKK